MTQITDIVKLNETLVEQKKKFQLSNMPTYKQRINDLKAVKKMLLDNQEAFISALSDDFGHRSKDDSKIGDLLTTVQGINYTIKRLSKWMKPQQKHVGILFQPAKAEVVFQPKGVIGIIAPWNYPIFLSLGPLVAALAAGNMAMIKMSEYSPKTSELLAKLLGSIFPIDKVAVVNGGVDIATAFTSLDFDHIFFTGSTTVGKLVMKAAAENLTPVTLELGGKSPAIIDKNMDINIAVSRFILGKTLNSGQTCVAPDYILCPKDKCAELIAAIKAHYTTMYPNVDNNDDCTCIVNASQHKRLVSMLDDATQKGATVIPCAEGGSINRKMPLTLVTNTSLEMAVMQEEIFGPILPIVPYENIKEAIDYVNDRPRPLALYIYSFNKIVQQKILTNTHAGGVCINDAAFHVAVDDLPFGGIGPSGMGQYHGEEGFKTFSHGKSVLTRGRISFASLLFPPFNTAFHKLVYKLFIR
jgi:coniferyl-aldehyde dehydrogenase